MIDSKFLSKACDVLFNCEYGKSAEAKIKLAIEKHGMMEKIKSGVVVGFSGGADSVLLLIFLWKIQKELNFPLLAIHVNHCIRGDAANSDACFSKEFCDALNIEFLSFSEDVPAFAEKNKMGTEEAARAVRYRIFDKVVSERDDIATVATAHNGTDNLETFIFNFMRGTGISGLCGIAPVRGNIIRPLIDLPKENISELLNGAKIPYVTDETNFSTEYTRNYIRHEILPKLERLSSSPAVAAARAIDNLRCDADYLAAEAVKYYVANLDNGRIEASKLISLHPSIFSRVIALMAKEHSKKLPEKAHVEKIRSLLSKGDDFELDIPGNIAFFRRYDVCFIKKKKAEDSYSEIFYTLNNGFNVIPELDMAVAVSDSKNEDFSSKVYKFSIQADMYSAIIGDVLHLRTRRAGDSYFYGGMTHKVKKLFNDKKLSAEERNTIPVICDEKGILWIPGFGVRCDTDECKNNRQHKWITLYKKVNAPE